MRPERRDAVAISILCLGTLLWGLWHLSSAPPPWWDEGWTLIVARQWVEHGRYSRLFLGEPAPATLAHGITVTGPVAGAFALFGAGFWQGRLFSVVCLTASSLLLFVLARRLFDRPTAWLTLLLAVLLPPLRDANALVLGRQVLGEMPMLAYLLGGLLCLHTALRKSAWWVLPSVAILASAVLAKSQLQVFFAAAAAAAVAHALAAGQRRSAKILAATASLALSAAWTIRALRPVLLPGFAVEPFDLTRLYHSTVMVLDPAERRLAARLVLLYGLPSVLGLGFALAALGRRLRDEREGGFVRTVWLGLAVAWVAWFALLGAAWGRYLFPGLYLASPFLAELVLRGWRRENSIRRALAAAVFLAALGLGARSLVGIVFQRGDDSAAETARWLNTETPAGAVIECYESEVLFLLDRPYRHPPIDTHTRMIEIFRAGGSGDVGYRVLPSEADYLVVGPFADTATLYHPELWGFHPTRQFGPYRVFERDRPSPRTAPSTVG